MPSANKPPQRRTYDDLIALAMEPGRYAGFEGGEVVGEFEGRELELLAEQSRRRGVKLPGVVAAGRPAPVSAAGAAADAGDDAGAADSPAGGGGGPVPPSSPPTTTTAPAGTGKQISNYSEHFNGSAVEVRPLPMQAILQDIIAATGGWPKRNQEALFVPGQCEGIPVNWLKKTGSLFGWLQLKCGTIAWSKKQGCATKEETYESLKLAAENYRSVEFLPHEPPIPGYYYSCGPIESGDGSTITELVNRFAPETESDRQLILCMFATVFWGGSGGSRPAFIITSDSGRGAGKSKLTDMISHLAGGCIELQQHEDSSKTRERLLSPDGLTKRLARLDNIKSLKLSWSDLESLITCHEISGKKMYVGEGTRPNTITWFLTFNGPSLSTDMAQRSVIIKIMRPRRVGSWEAETLAFIDANRSKLISDLIGFLRLPQKSLPQYTRWARWEQEVLSKLPQPDVIQKLIVERSGGADTDQEEIEVIEEFFSTQLEKYDYMPGSSKVHIPSQIAGEWFNHAMNERRSTIQACRIIAQFISEGRVARLSVNPSRKHGRGFLWNGTDITDTSSIHYDLEGRISVKRRDRSF